MDSIAAKEIINWADSEEDWDSIISTIKERCELGDTDFIAMRIVRDFGYKRKDTLIPNPTTEYTLTTDLYKDLYDLCQREDCKNGCQLMQEPDGTYYFQITGQCFSDTRTDSIVGCDTVKVYMKGYKEAINECQIN